MKNLSQHEALIKLMPHLDTYDLTDVMPKLYARHLTQSTGLHFSSDGELYGLEFSTEKAGNVRFKYDYPDPHDLTDTVLKALKNTYGSDFENLKIWQDTHRLFTDRYFTKVKDGQYQMRSDGASELAYILDYVVNGELGKDYARAHEAWEQKHPQYGGYQNKLSVVGTHTSDMVKGITVKVYANGRIDIKGLTPEQLKKLDELSEMAHRIKAIVPKY